MCVHAPRLDVVARHAHSSRTVIEIGIDLLNVRVHLHDLLFV
jgi:hypothetical protein